jgi:hypothetical protein
MTIKLIFVASPINMKHKGERGTAGEWWINFFWQESMNLFKEIKVKLDDNFSCYFSNLKNWKWGNFHHEHIWHTHCLCSDSKQWKLSSFLITCSKLSKIWQIKVNCISYVMVSFLTLSALDHGFKTRSGQTNDYKIDICCLYQ